MHRRHRTLVLATLLTVPIAVPALCQAPPLNGTPPAQLSGGTPNLGLSGGPPNLRLSGGSGSVGLSGGAPAGLSGGRGLIDAAMLPGPLLPFTAPAVTLPGGVPQVSGGLSPLPGSTPGLRPSRPGLTPLTPTPLPVSPTP